MCQYLAGVCACRLRRWVIRWARFAKATTDGPRSMTTTPILCRPWNNRSSNKQSGTLFFKFSSSAEETSARNARGGGEDRAVGDEPGEGGGTLLLRPGVNRRPILAPIGANSDPAGVSFRRRSALSPHADLHSVRELELCTGAGLDVAAVVLGFPAASVALQLNAHGECNGRQRYRRERRSLAPGLDLGFAR